MTEDELKAIEERANAATPGPWIDKLMHITGMATPRVVILAGDGAPVAMVTYEDPDPAGDAKFLSAAREDVPKLIAEIRRLSEYKAWATKRINEKEDEILYWIEKANSGEVLE